MAGRNTSQSYISTSNPLSLHAIGLCHHTQALLLLHADHEDAVQEQQQWRKSCNDSRMVVLPWPWPPMCSYIISRTMLVGAYTQDSVETKWNRMCLSGIPQSWLYERTRRIHMGPSSKPVSATTSTLQFLALSRFGRYLAASTVHLLINGRSSHVDTTACQALCGIHSHVCSFHCSSTGVRSRESCMWYS